VGLESLAMPEHEPGYVLDPNWEHERRRLALLEQVWDGLSTARLAALGVAPGARCLEIGGGGGSIARWLCREVGEAGHVTAVDLDTRWLDQLAEPNLTVVQHDLTETEAPFEAASFDFIHARAVFEHIAARDAVLEGVCRWLAPGGWLSVSDCVSFSVESTPNPVYGTAMRAWVESLRKTGTDYEWGRCLPAHLQRQGLEAIGGEAHVTVLRGGSPVAEFWSLGLELLRPRITEMQLATGEEIDAARTLLADPEFWDLSPAFVAAWGRRAAS
jgi:SAM-dependent methyltransferase